jgi:amino acid transporter
VLSATWVERLPAVPGRLEVDAGVGGVVVASMYLVAAVASFAAMRAYRANAEVAERVDPDEATVQRTLGGMWFVVGLLMVAFAANKQLDIQQWVADRVRDLARRQGWYERRREVQAVVIGGVAVVSLLVAGLLAYRLRHVLRRAIAVVVTVAAIVAFAVVRAVSLHHIDSVLNAAGGWVRRLLEVATLLVLSALAARGRATARADRAAYLRRLAEAVSAPLAPSHAGPPLSAIASLRRSRRP